MSDPSLVDLAADSSAPWDFRLDLVSGAVLIGRDEWPDVEVLSSQVLRVEEINVQMLKLNNPDTGESVLMRRLVGRLENGKHIDIGERFSVSSELVEQNIDTSRCGACLGKIDREDLVIYQGSAYHRNCMEDG